MFEAFTGTPLILPSDRRVPGRVSLLIEFGYPVLSLVLVQSADLSVLCCQVYGNSWKAWSSVFAAFWCHFLPGFYRKWDF